jgi:hypothetical protein
MTDTNRRGRKSERSALEARRRTQLQEITAVVEGAQQHLSDCRKHREKHRTLVSVATGLYEEVDKVSKKAPAESVTQLVYEEVNQVIKESKELARDDAYVQRLKEFVAAGENPPYRDVVVVLKLSLQGLARFSERLDALERDYGAILREARVAKCALEYFLEYGEVPTRDILRDRGATPSPDWIDDTLEEDTFRFERLDQMNMAVYFSAEGRQS